MVKLGLSPLDAIIASTRHSAECLRLDRRIGTIEPGKEADILIMDGNPLRDIGIVAKKEKIRGVIKGGKKAVWRIPAS